MKSWDDFLRQKLPMDVTLFHCVLLQILFAFLSAFIASFFGFFSLLFGANWGPVFDSFFSFNFMLFATYFLSSVGMFSPSGMERLISV